MHHMGKRKSSDSHEPASERLLLREPKNNRTKQQDRTIEQNGNRRRLATLARAETMEDDDHDEQSEASKSAPKSNSGRTCGGVLRCLRRKRIFIPLIILACIAAIYCLPYIEIEPRIPRPLPHILFNFREGPLQASSASQFRAIHLFRDQISGPESVAIDSQGNMYMAVEGGFILYAYLNRSHLGQAPGEQTESAVGQEQSVDLVKIAELNGIKQLPHDHRRRRAEHTGGASWRRECQLDEKVYGPNLFAANAAGKRMSNGNEIDTGSPIQPKRFVSNVRISRCSKPLGIRLSPDESHLYVVDTLSGLFRISLKVFDKPHSSQRQVTKLIDFRANASQTLPILQLDVPASGQSPVPVTVPPVTGPSGPTVQMVPHLNITMRAADDLTIDYGAGTNKGDIIYLSLASQNWQASSFIYDLLEGRPSGALLRYDTGSNQLSVLNPSQVAHVRLSSLESANESLSRNPAPLYGMGAPHLDENDVFDDRPLYFPNGLQLTDDRQAILVADTVNKRIIKHWIRGPRKGTSDLWAWTPNYPDNIRRGFHKERETYWVVGCGQDTTDKIDLLRWLNDWPRLRKYLLKKLYLFGWTVEMLGAHLLRSTSVRDFGYGLKTGHTLNENACMGMMILQYNSYGDIIRSIYSKEFPNDLTYYSQANEVIDANKQEHVLYLSSPGYHYVTKLILPTESFNLAPPSS